MAFSCIFKRFSREKINDISAEKHRDDPIWFDTHWDKLVSWFRTENEFHQFIRSEFIFIREPSIEMLGVFQKHKLNFKAIGFNNIDILKQLSFDVFKWLVDNKIVRRRDNSTLCNEFLNVGDQVSFEKFKCLFEAGFPFDLKMKLSFKDINSNDECTNNVQGLEFKYSIDLEEKSVAFLIEYLSLIQRRNMSSQQVYNSENILETLINCKSIKTHYINNKNISPNVKRWLKSHGFTKENVINVTNSNNGLITT